jgi:hypothetical protein
VSFQLETIPATFVQRYSHWAESFTDAPPQFHRYIGYWIVSALLGRRVYCHFGDEWLFPNLWLVVLAPSSFYRKSTALSIGSRIVNAARPGLVLPSEFTQECLVALMQQQPHCTLVAYEFRSLLSLMQKDYNTGLQSLLTELYDSPQEYVRKKGVTDVKEFRIEKPYLTILGASTLDWLLASVQSGDISGGFLARFLFVSADSKNKIMAFQPKADQHEKERLIESVKSVASVAGEMGYAIDARRHYEEWYGGFFRRSEDAPEAVRAFFPRLTAYAHKFAMLESVIAGHHPRITLSDVKTACLIADSFAAEIRRLGTESLGKSKFDAYKAKILKTINKHPGIEHSRLLRNTGVSAKILKDVIETLRQSQEIEVREGNYYPIVVSEAVR